MVSTLKYGDSDRSSTCANDNLAEMVAVRRSIDPADRAAWLLQIADVKWVRVARIYFGVLMLEKMRVERDLSQNEQGRLWDECITSIQRLMARGLLELQGDLVQPGAAVRLTALAQRQLQEAATFDRSL